MRFNNILKTAFTIFMGAAFCGNTFGAELNLKFGTYLPPTAVASDGQQVFIKNLESLSKGKVKYTFYSGGSLTSATTALSSMRDGIVDSNIVVPDYFPTELPALKFVMNLAVGLENAWIYNAAMMDTVLHDCTQCMKELKNFDIQPLWIYGTTPYYLICSMRDGNNAEDLSGYRVRVPGSLLGRLSEALGLTPDTMPNSEAYLALQQHKLNCFEGPIGWSKSLSLHEVTNTVIKMPLAPNFGVLVDLKASKWNKLDNTLKTAFRIAAIEGGAATLERYYRDDNEIVNNSKKYGMRIVDAPASLRSKMSKFQNEYIANILAPEAKKRGISQTDDLVKSFHRNIDKWSKLIGNEPMTQEKYVEIIQEHLKFE